MSERHDTRSDIEIPTPEVLVIAADGTQTITIVSPLRLEVRAVENADVAVELPLIGFLVIGMAGSAVVAEAPDAVETWPADTILGAVTALLRWRKRGAE